MSDNMTRRRLLLTTLKQGLLLIKRRGHVTVTNPVHTPTIIGIVGLCEDRNSSFMRGASQAPDVIRLALKCDASNTWTELGCDVTQHIVEYGNVFPASSSKEDMFSSIHPIFSKLLNNGHVPITLGGDHSVTYPLCKAISERHGPVVILHLDAHPDLYDDFEGNSSSHASPFARICEENMCKKLIQVGIRTLNAHQREQALRFSSHIIEARHTPMTLNDTKSVFHNLGISPTDKVYLSMDIDVLDPAYAPGVSHREPGGLSTRQALNFIQCCPGIVVGMDLVEYNVSRDLDGMTATVAAKIVKEMVGRIVMGVAE